MPTRVSTSSRIVRLPLLCAAATLVALAPVRAQELPRTVRVEGVAFDSLTNRPLPDAFVAVSGTGRSTTSDSKGRFRLDSVPEGEQTLTMQHAAFDSLGLSGASQRVTVRNRMPRVVLAVPSFGTLWRAACGQSPAPADSALLYGTLRSADGAEPSERGVVEVSWVDLVGGGSALTSVGQRRWRRAVETDDRGEFALCGVALGVPLQLRASSDPSDTTSFMTLQLEATTSRVQRRDVRLAPVARAVADGRVNSTPLDSATAARDTTPSRTATGVVTGIVTNAGGIPIADAVIAVDTLVEVRSGADGRFRVSDVGPGTRQTLVVAIGMTPKTVTMDIAPGDTTQLVIAMQPVQILDAVNVRANASTVAGLRIRTYEEHRRTGMGDFRDSTSFIGQTSIMTALRMIPGLSVRVVPGGELEASTASCRGFSFFLDGRPSSSSEFLLQQPADLAAMEVYKRRLIYPSDAYPCSIMLWTKYGFGR